MNTVDVLVAANTWTELPATTTAWLAQNTGQHVIVVRTAATAPANTVKNGHRLESRLSMGPLSTQKHWMFCEQNITVCLTENDIE